VGPSAARLLANLGWRECGDYEGHRYQWDGAAMIEQLYDGCVY
jgi:hypothetical protein